MSKSEYILGAIGVVWPATWALWEWYWKERKVRLNVSGYRFGYKLNKAGVIQSVWIQIIIFNYADRPAGIAEGWLSTNYDKHKFIKIYKGNEPLRILSQRTITIEHELNKKGEKIKEARLYLADDRKFVIKGLLIKKLNDRLACIGEKYKDLSSELKNY